MWCQTLLWLKSHLHLEEKKLLCSLWLVSSQTPHFHFFRRLSPPSISLSVCHFSCAAFICSCLSFVSLLWGQRIKLFHFSLLSFFHCLLCCFAVKWLPLLLSVLSVHFSSPSFRFFNICLLYSSSHFFVLQKHTNYNDLADLWWRVFHKKGQKCRKHNNCCYCFD